ncbi:MAG: DUF6377 domain-containing protein, partial [Bacteroidales bacterium]
MISKYFIFFFCLIYLSLYGADRETDPRALIVDSHFRQLDYEIANVKKYEVEKGKRIGFLKSSLEKEKNLHNKILLNEKLYGEYNYYIYDSAFYYLNSNIALLKGCADKTAFVKYNLFLCNLYISNGIYWEVESMLENMDKRTLPDYEKNLFISTEARLNYYLYLIGETPVNKQKYLDKFMNIEDTLSVYGSDIRNMTADIQYYYYECKNDLDKIRSLIDDILNDFGNDRRIYSVAFQWKAKLARDDNEFFKEIFYLVQASIYEHRNCIKNGGATFDLARLMFEYGQINRAYKYVQIVHSDASRSNSVRHKSRSAELLAMITRSYETQMQETYDRLYHYLFIIGLLSLGLFLAGFFLVLQMKKLSVTKNKLQVCHEEQVVLNDKLNVFNNRLLENNSLKEEYICSFLQMRPDYIESMNDYRKQVLRLVKDKKFADVFEFCKSNKRITREYDKLHAEFDKMF